ncbi:MAG: hypothetical protein PHT12_01755 [Patescibacteria group bacterium]|nr:hypothetical protein [Patescibacteria group bacterium]
MLFYIAILIVIALCLVGIGVIVARKFPQLTMIDAEALPKERETKKKKEIIESRVRRVAAERTRLLGAALKPVWERLRDGFRVAYGRLLSLDKMYQRPGKQPTAFEKRLKAARLIERAAALVDQAGKEGEAEKLLVEAIGLDPKNLDAYRVLGDLYFGQKNYLQAREAYDFLARSSIRECCGRRGRGQQPRHVSLEYPCDAPAAQAAFVSKNYASLAAACRQLGEGEKAKAALEMAAAHEPANPRTLDLLLEACILVGDKARAEEVLGRLKAANPDNQKLGALEERIAALPAPVVAHKPAEKPIETPSVADVSPSPTEGPGVS